MIEALQKACYEAGHFIGVRESLLETGCTLISGVELQFEKLTIAVSAVADDDTVSVSFVPLPQSDICRPSTHQFWQPCIGKGLQWAWSMTNQQGYTDGMRFEFHNPDESESVIVELIAMASGLHFFSVSGAKV